MLIESQLLPPSDHLYVAANILLQCWKQMIITLQEIPLLKFKLHAMQCYFLTDPHKQNFDTI